MNYLHGKIRKKYIYYIACSVLAMCLLAAGLASYNQHVSTMIADQQASMKVTLAKLDQDIATALARKEAEERAEAVATSNTVKTIDTTEARLIDATTCNAGGTHTDPTKVDVVVNKKHCMQPLTFAPNDLVTVAGATLSTKAADSFQRMHVAAEAAGQGFTVTSSYRSFNDQVSTYQYWVNISGAAGADTYSARPGYSEHQTGLVVDVAAGGCVLDCFGTTSQYQWMQQYAADYGFIQRYYEGSEAVTGYKAEEWHYRYVGVATAQDMKQRGIKTLEEYWRVTGGDY